MTSTLRAIISQGRIETLEPVDLPEGSEVLVTVTSQGGEGFWLGASRPTLAEIWDNPEDDVYASLLED